MLISLDCASPQRLLWRQLLHAFRNGNRTHLPSRIDEDRRDTFNHCDSLTPTASFLSAEHLRAAALPYGHVQLQRYVPIATSLARVWPTSYLYELPWLHL